MRFVSEVKDKREKDFSLCWSIILLIISAEKTACGGSIMIRVVSVVLYFMNIEIFNAQSVRRKSVRVDG